MTQGAFGAIALALCHGRARDGVRSFWPPHLVAPAEPVPRIRFDGIGFTSPAACSPWTLVKHYSAM